MRALSGPPAEPLDTATVASMCWCQRFADSGHSVHRGDPALGPGQPMGAIPQLKVALSAMVFRLYGPDWKVQLPCRNRYSVGVTVGVGVRRGRQATYQVLIMS